MTKIGVGRDKMYRQREKPGLRNRVNRTIRPKSMEMATRRLVGTEQEQATPGDAGWHHRQASARCKDYSY